MKSLLCKLFSMAALATLATLPIAADDAGVFQLGQNVTIGDVELPAGVYTFQATHRGLVLVYDESRTKVVASALTSRTSLKLGDAEMAGTLSYDRAVRGLSLGDWHYTFFPAGKPPVMASNRSVTTVVAMTK